jgi:hypothetical protein
MLTVFFHRRFDYSIKDTFLINCRGNRLLSAWLLLFYKLNLGWPSNSSVPNASHRGTDLDRGGGGDITTVALQFTMAQMQ